MKRIAQLAAILAIALLVVQPAFAGATCLFGPAAACVSGCPMMMPGMGPDCPMNGQTVSSGCPMDCCSHAATQATEPVVAPEKSRVTVLHVAVADQTATAIPNRAIPSQVVTAVAFSSPPRYILNQTFRI